VELYLFSPIYLHGVGRENFQLLAACSRMDRSVLVCIIMKYKVAAKRNAGQPLKETCNVILRLEWASRPKALKAQ
jgi:hypothetical protein